jgi:tripartite-type tricarboxylate transporter receptor subunit TctC
MKITSIPSIMSVAALALCGVVGSACAQGAADAAAAKFPTKPVTLVIPYPPGGPTDITGRFLAEKLGKLWGQPVIIENKAGAGGNVGSAYVAKAAPDGYTLVLGITGSHAINKWLYKNMPYDQQKDFVPVSLAVVYSNAIVANPSFPANNIQEMIALAKKDPEKWSYGSDGNGAASHLSMELLKEAGKFKITHIPYKGSAPLLNDVIGNQVPVGITGLPSAEPLIKAGKLKLLGITTAQDYTGNNYPTIAGQGFPGFDYAPFSGIFAPKGTPMPIVEKISADMRKVLSEPDAKEAMAKLGLQVDPDTPQQFAEFLAKQSDAWHKAVQISGATVD